MKLRDVAFRPQETVAPHDSVARVESLLLRDMCVVVEHEGNYRGLLTLADVVARPHTLVVDCLGPKPMLDGGLSLEHALDQMAREGQHFVPVGDASRFIGVASYKTVVEAFVGLGGAEQPPVLPRSDLPFVAAGVAHDLRNLLFVLGGQLEMFAELEGSVTPERLAPVTQALGQAQHLTARLLRLAKDEPPVAATGELRRFIEQTVRFYATGSGGQVDLTLAELPAAEGLYSHELGRVIANLVVNAIQASPPGSTVRVEASTSSAAEGAPPLLQLVVANEGPAIDEHLLPRIFEPRVTSRRRGSGLGLAIVRAIVTRSGGTVVVASSASETAFTVRMPLQPLPEKG